MSVLHRAKAGGDLPSKKEMSRYEKGERRDLEHTIEGKSESAPFLATM